MESLALAVPDATRPLLRQLHAVQANCDSQVASFAALEKQLRCARACVLCEFCVCFCVCFLCVCLRIFSLFCACFSVFCACFLSLFCAYFLCVFYVFFCACFYVLFLCVLHVFSVCPACFLCVCYACFLCVCRSQLLARESELVDVRQGQQELHRDADAAKVEAMQWRKKQEVAKRVRVSM